MTTEASGALPPASDSTSDSGRDSTTRTPRWVLGLGPVVLIAIAIGLFAFLNAPGITGGENRVPEEAVVVETVTLEPGEILLTVRNEGIDPVRIAQVNISDFYAPFTQTREEIEPLESSTITVAYNWVEGDPYDIRLITSVGGTVDATIDAAVESPERGASFFGLMALLGVYVGVIPIAIGLLWMPFVRRSSRDWVRGLLGFTIGLLGYLAIDATLEGLELVEGTSAFGGGIIVFLGALTAYLALEGVEGLTAGRRATGAPMPPRTLALLIALGIGLHNLGEGLVIGSAYAVGSLALGSYLVIGFAIHNTTEGLAIVTPLAEDPPRVPFLLGMGLIAGAPAILGAVLGATAYQPNLAALLFGVGAGALAQVAVKLLPLIRDRRTGRIVTPLTSAGIIIGVVFMFVTGLLVAV